MVALDAEAKKEAGKILSDAKSALTEAYEAKENHISTSLINEKLNQDIVDISLPGSEIDQ
jgi:phenylalanyl-tRNA synthetase alpha subunit